MNKEQILKAAVSLSIDEITYLVMELSKVKSLKIRSRSRIKAKVVLASYNIHPVCKI